MQVMMEHPDHGRMPVYSEANIKANEKNGWSVVKDEAPVKKTTRKKSTRGDSTNVD